MKKQPLAVSILFLFSIALTAQDTGLEVINSGGGIGQAGDLSVQWSLGEVAVQSSSVGDMFATEGFIQPYLVITEMENELSDERITEQVPFNRDVIRVFPNPFHTSVEVTLDAPFTQPVDVVVTTLEGRVVRVLQSMPGDRRISVDMAYLPAGLYLLRVSDQRGLIFKTFRITKV